MCVCDISISLKTEIFVNVIDETAYYGKLMRVMDYDVNLIKARIRRVLHSSVDFSVWHPDVSRTNRLRMPSVELCQ